MSDGLMLMIGKDGVAREYKDDYDIVIHCASQEEYDKVWATLNRRWIPCRDRLPEDDVKVLCQTMTKKGLANFVIGYHYSNGWACGMNRNVIAWMPLPEPYKEEM